MSIDIDKVHVIQFGILDIDKSNVTAPGHFAICNSQCMVMHDKIPDTSPVTTRSGIALCNQGCIIPVGMSPQIVGIHCY